MSEEKKPTTLKELPDFEIPIKILKQIHPADFSVRFESAIERVQVQQAALNRIEELEEKLKNHRNVWKTKRFDCDIKSCEHSNDLRSRITELKKFVGLEK